MNDFRAARVLLSLKGLHHFASPKYYAFSRIFIEVIKRFYLN